MPIVRKIPPPSKAPAAEAPLITVAELDGADPRPRLADVVTALDTSAPLAIDLALIDDNPYQTRIAYDDEKTREIAASIKKHGLLQVPIARPIAGGRYQLAFGHTRLRSYRLLAVEDAARFSRMPLTIRELDDETMFLHAWSENRDRKDLTAYEEARAIENSIQTFGWTQKQAAERLGLTQPTIANKLRLLKLPAAALEQLKQGAISERQALALLPLADLPESTLKRAESGYGYKPSRVIAEASKASSDDLRQQVEHIMRSATVELKVDWRDFDFGGVQGIESARCTDCALRSNGRCAGPACFQVKQQTWTGRRLEQAAKKFGIPALGKEPAYNEAEKFYSGEEFTRQILAAGCDKLRICAGGYGGIDLKGFPDLHAICAHGAGKKCSCLMKLRAAAAKSDPAKIQEKENKKQVAELKATAARQLADAIMAQERGAWLEVLRNLDYEYRKADGSSATLESIVKGIAAKLVSSAMPYTSDRPDHVRQSFEKLFQRCGMPSPWAAASAAADLRANTAAAASPLDPIRRALQAVSDWLDEDEQDTAPEAIQSALAELAEARKRLEQLSGAPDVSDAEYQEISGWIWDLETDVRDLQESESEVGA